MKIKLLGECSKKSLEKRIKIVCGAGKLSRSPGNVFDVLENCNDYEKNLKIIKTIISMGHESIIEHDYLVFALVDVTPIVEQTIIGNRLTSFTIKSRREVDFRNVGFYTPEFRNEENVVHPKNKELQREYKKHMKWLFNEYCYFADNNINKEDSRFILPYSYYSNIIMGLDARELKKLILSLLTGKRSKITELKELGLRLFEIVKEYVPYLVDSIEREILLYKEDNKFKDMIDMRHESIEILKHPMLLNCTKDVEKQIVLSYLMGEYQLQYYDANKIYNEKYLNNKELLNEIIKFIALKTENRELEQVSFQFQIPISLAVLTHLTRHRMHSLIIPEFTPIWDLRNYSTPDSIKNFDLERYNNAYRKNLDIYSRFKALNVKEEDLIYFYLSGQRLNVITTMNGRFLKWFATLRTCNKAQWEIRNIAEYLVAQVKKISPIYGSYLGPTCEIMGYCPEGKESCKIKNKEGQPQK